MTASWRTRCTRRATARLRRWGAALYDARLGALAVCADSPTFHIRASSDGGVTFDSEVNPAGSEFYSDWAIGNGKIFVSGTSGANSALVYVIAASDLTSSSTVSGLPTVSSSQTRSLAADTDGNAFVASQLDAGGVQLDRLAAGGIAFDPLRTISATGGSPVVAPLPGSGGAAVVYTDGTEGHRPGVLSDRGAPGRPRCGVLPAAGRPGRRRRPSPSASRPPEHFP